MIFGIQRDLRWYHVVLWPVALPVMAVLIAPFAVAAVIDRMITRAREMAL